MFTRRGILLTLIVMLSAAMLGSMYDPRLEIFAQRPPKEPVIKEVTDYWQGTVDSELKHINEKFTSIQHQIAGIRDDIQGLCDQTTDIRVKMAQSGAVYGGAAGILIQLFGLMGKGLLNKKRKRNGE